MATSTIKTCFVAAICLLMCLNRSTEAQLSVQSELSPHTPSNDSAFKQNLKDNCANDSADKQNLYHLLELVRLTSNFSEAKSLVGNSLARVADSNHDGRDLVTLLSSMQKKHPRVLVTDADLCTVRGTIISDSNAAHLYDVLNKRAEDMLHSKSPAYSIHPEEALAQARVALKRITTFAGLYRLNHDARFLEQARKDMLKIAAFPDWGPANFLDVAEMTASMGIGYDWLFNQLSAQDRTTIRDAILAKGLDPGLKQYRGDGWWRTANSNWNFVCNGGLTVGALAVAEDDPVLASKVVACGATSISLAIKSLEPDGGWSEGPMYWTYGTRYLVYFLQSLRSALDNDYGLSKSSGLSETGYFRIYTESPTGNSFNYADSETEVGRGAQMFWLSKEFRMPVFEGAELHVSEIFPEMFHLLFYRREHITPAAAKLPLHKLFKGVNVACFRSSWSDPSAAFLGFKGGDNTSHHAHLDLGSFVFDVDGLRWAEDLGPDNYDLPGYFSKQRWIYYRTKTEGHNTLTVGAKNQNIEAKSVITEFSADEENPYAVADLSAAYNGDLLSAKRGIRFNGTDGITVQDEIVAPQAVPLTWHLKTMAHVQFESEKNCLRLTQESKAGTKNMFLEIVSPPEATFSPQVVKFERPQNNKFGVTDITIPLNLKPGQTTISVRMTRSVGQKVRLQKLADWSKTVTAN